MARDPSVFVHALALCESDDVGPRTRVWAFAHVREGAHIGADCNVGGHAFVEGGAVVGDGVTIKNGVLLWSRVTVEDGVFLAPAPAPSIPRARPAGGPPWCGTGPRWAPTPPSCPG
jgi:UDP-2-acetamido-3-amino-2,3-dideoxy-glucuronate N-acetyltransferase